MMSSTFPIIVFHAVRYIRQALRIRRLGKFTKKENDKEEEWEEPHEDDVPDEVWVQISDGGFGGFVKMRDLRWSWSRRAKLAEQVELLELGKAGGVSHKRKRDEIAEHAEDAEDVMSECFVEHERW